MDPLHYIIGPQPKKTCLWWFAKNKGADQPAHPHSLIRAFVIQLLESFISKLQAKFQLSSLVSVAEEAGLNLTFSKILKTVFVAARPI